jgi:hypothetical protein
MSLAQIEAEVSRLSRQELEHLQRTVGEALRREPIVESPELLKARRKLVDEFLAGDECVNLEGFEESGTAAQPVKVVATPEMLARRREISQKFRSGEWSVDLPSYEEIKAEAELLDGIDLEVRVPCRP